MKVLISLCFVLLTAESIASAAPLNNSTVPVPETVQVQPEQVNEPPQEVQAPVSEVPPPVEPERPPEAPPVQTVSHAIGCENYVQLVNQYDWNVTVALQVAKAESGCNPMAVGDNRVIGGIYAPSCGLFQIRTLQGRPSCEQLQNPATNIEWAYKLYGASGWRPWSVCNHGIVSCY